ncbi:phosphoenolpyruvate carboxylase [Croceicoccus hydrothermalis]|uniref:phosphoenolpyruvate carboxylase n=1 Tax=Croceicoccus hydrothermalis TaxID=2867964 RepID=UPI001EFB2BAE|nr:phosphoenolpyruvate carboxylase [Croceicoccus hydrothermalis]
MSPKIEKLHERLRELHQRTRETPMFNPVFQLGLEFSRDLESGETDLRELDRLVSALECEGMQARAHKLHRMLEPIATDANLASFDPREGETFADYAARFGTPLMHVVFTAHPTFLLTPAQANAVTEAASKGDVDGDQVCTAPHERVQITLDSEHDAAMRAIERAQGARDRVVRHMFETARDRWPEDWRTLKPVPLRLATWVGYDMDGRTDIGWNTSIRYRLQEKAERLAGYAGMLSAAAPDIAGKLAAAADHTSRMAVLFGKDMSDPAALSHAANSLTADDDAKITTLEPIIAGLEGRAQDADDDTATTLLTTVAAMRADGLGMGHIHFRVNASQLKNAIRRRVDPQNRLDLSSQAALSAIRTAIEELTPLQSNFAALGIEASTAIRQFLAMQQILTHIDADAPIRMLIAECEQPQTVLAALYFARLFGVEDKVDVSPLFETEAALEHGGRFLDALLAEEVFQTYARRRGRIAIQTGFSDAGRFVGQIPASLAIERLQGRLAEAMDANGLNEVAALIFNTHGEGMGRGAHPASMKDRLEWPLSPWARRRFVRRAIRLEPEVSFQGGDGYMWFGTPELALATLARMADNPPNTADPDVPTDMFYRRTDLSLDFYRAIRRVQHNHLISRTYSRAITAFGLGLLNDTGSRRSRRQSDLSADREMSLRQIRAIPHNAILQQLGYPVNIIAGFGTAADANREEIANLLSESERGQQLLRLVRSSDALASIKTVAAFGELFNSAYWASRPYRGTETHLTDACLDLAEMLTKDDRTGVFRRLASRLRVDALHFHRLLEAMPGAKEEWGMPLSDREHKRRTIGVLQAIRLALLQHMFLRAVQMPAFSRSNDISREDVLEMVFTLRIEDALAQMRRAFPVTFPSIDDFDVDAPSEYPDGGDGGYRAIHRDYIEPIEQAYALVLRIGTAIANEFGAHG